MSSFRGSVRGLSAFLASLSLLGSGSASFAAGGKNAKVGHGGQPRGFDVKKGANQGEGKGKGKDKDENRKGRKDKVNDLSTAPAARGSSKPSSVSGEIYDFAKKTGASFSEMSTLAKVAGVVGIGELVSILSTSRGLIERLAIWLEVVVRRSFDKSVFYDAELRRVIPEVDYDMAIYDVFVMKPTYAPIRPLFNLLMWGKNIIPDRVFAFLAGYRSEIVDRSYYLGYTFSCRNGAHWLNWKPTFFNRLIYKLGRYLGEKKKKEGENH